MSEFVFGGLKSSAEHRKPVKLKYDIPRIELLVKRSGLISPPLLKVKQYDFKILSDLMYKKWEWEKKVYKKTVTTTLSTFDHIRKNRKALSNKDLLFEFQSFLWRTLVMRLSYNSFVSVKHHRFELWVLREEPTIILIDGPRIARNFWMSKISLEEIKSIPQRINASVNDFIAKNEKNPSIMLFSDNLFKTSDENILWYSSV